MSAPPGWLTVPAAPPSRREGGRVCVLGFGRGLGPAETFGDMTLLPDAPPIARWEQVDLGRLGPRPQLEALDRHRLDVCLSRGRQAAERAHLAGCRLVWCLGPDGDQDPRPSGRCVPCKSRQTACGALDPFAWITSAPLAPGLAYACLQRLACLELAALTGALIASAQMGIRVSVLGETARMAARLAQGINPGLALWLDDRPPAGWIASQRSPEAMPSLAVPDQGMR